jgi:hypothetical protein
MKNIDMKSLMKQAERMQRELAEKQEKLESIEITASSGGGVVTVTVTASMKIKSIVIQKEIVDPNDISMLQDLIMTAVNNALQLAEKKSNEVMNQVSSGLMPAMRSLK